MESLSNQSDVLFILLGAIMVLAMHAGFAFLEVVNCQAKKTKLMHLPKLWQTFLYLLLLIFLLLQHCIWN